MAELLGKLEGRVEAEAILVETSGAVKGELLADLVTINGSFSGKVAAKTVALNSGAIVNGEIKYQTLIIESGADVTLSCTRGNGST